MTNYFIQIIKIIKIKEPRGSRSYRVSEVTQPIYWKNVLFVKTYTETRKKHVILSVGNIHHALECMRLLLSSCAM
jgi:hypothetical protein